MDNQSNTKLYLPIHKDEPLDIVSGISWERFGMDDYAVIIIDEPSIVMATELGKRLSNILADIPHEVLGKWAIINKESLLSLYQWAQNANMPTPGSNHAAKK
jgi:hypothetical protein